MYHRFRQDGLCHVAIALEDVGEHPDAIMEYWFEGTQLYLKEIDAPGLPTCGPEPAVYEVELLADGKLLYRWVQDYCTGRTRSTKGTHTPVR
jgi:hypothetical protein